MVVGAATAAGVARWQIRRALARQLAAERRARGAERMAELGAMTGGLAHEIKNPLSTIGLNAQLLGEGVSELPEDRPVTDEAKRRLLRRVESLRRETERLRGILADFLRFAGELRLERAARDVNRIVEELADFLQPQAQASGARLRLELSPEAPIADVDVGQLKQALLNLMLNAVQAMGSSQAKGEVGEASPRELIVRTRVAPAPSVPAKRGDKGPGRGGAGWVVVHVIDTGPGISDEARARMFTPYFTTKSGGTGLGLATTRRIIEAHGGRIEVFSEVGKGTDFAVWLERAGEVSREGGA
jgi:signal transduction histidine kinase